MPSVLDTLTTTEVLSNQHLQQSGHGGHGGSEGNITPTTANPGSLCEYVRVTYQIAPAVICAMCFVFGIVYTFFGYRFFKATMFLTGFIFGSLVAYLICLEENLLPIEGKIGVSLAAGVLLGLITMMVQYVGLFMTGFHLGIFLVMASLIVMEQFYHPVTKWIPIGMLFGAGLLFALLNLYFQKGLTILGTSIFGSALITVAVDYFVETFVMLRYIWDRIKAEQSEPVCWFSWLILGLWPLILIVGTITQWRVTGKGFDHHEVVVQPRHKKRKVDLQKMREKDRQETFNPGTIHSRYRHLYQVRRWNGDVISQNQVQNVQALPPNTHKLHPPAHTQRLNDTDSTQTSLTQVP